MAQAHLSLSSLIMQYQTALRTAPSPVGAKVLPYTSFPIGRDPRRQANATINKSPLGNKTDEGEPIVQPAALTSVLDLRSIGYLLKLLLGQPVTTGTTLKSHVFPIDLNDRPYALMEVAHPDINKFFRFYGCHCNKISWDIKNNDQTISAEILAAQEVNPIPTTAFDAAPTSVASFRANSGSGKIWDGAGTTLGQVIGGTIEISNNMKPKELADGSTGYSLFRPEDLTFKGKIQAVFDGAGAYDMARTGTSTRMDILTAATIGANTFDLNVDMPAVEFIEKAVPRSGKSGIVVDLDWSAHTSTTLPTVTLRNDVASY